MYVFDIRNLNTYESTTTAKKDEWFLEFIMSYVTSVMRREFVSSLYDQLLYETCNIII